MHPPIGIADISGISDATVNTYAASYGIPDLDPMPAATVFRALAVQGEQGSQGAAFGREYVADVPEGYLATSVHVGGAIQFDELGQGVVGDITNYFFLSVSNFGRNFATPLSENRMTSAVTVSTAYEAIDGVATKIPVAILAVDVLSYALTVTIKMTLTDEAKRKWQIKTYQRIMNAYNARLADYMSRLAEYEDKQAGFEVSEGIIIRGRNPLMNLEIIRTELKKHCITMLAKQFDTEKADDVRFDAMKSRKEDVLEATSAVTETKKVTTTTPVPLTTVTVTETTISEATTSSPVEIDIPAIDIAEAREEGLLVQFLEQAFEWAQISYLLYPYFWGRVPDKWFKAHKYYDEEDPHFPNSYRPDRRAC